MLFLLPSPPLLRSVPIGDDGQHMELQYMSKLSKLYIPMYIYIYRERERCTHSVRSNFGSRFLHLGVRNLFVRNDQPQETSNIYIYIYVFTCFYAIMVELHPCIETLNSRNSGFI